ncbi:MAG: TraB family protein, partial [Deltaproteobacteria bacterium]|nr:TraB family protein [Deltaproteobacteria bacterium]
MESTLPESVSKIIVEEKDIYLVGTAHVSKESVDDVGRAVAAVQPDAVCVELCEARYKSMVQREAWQQMNIFKVIREKKALLLLAQLIMNSFYRRIGEHLGVQPGAEMMEGIRLAQKTGAELVLADREVEITLKRVWGYLNLWNKLKMMVQLLAGLLVSEKIDEDLVENMKKQDQLETIMETFAKAFPEVKKRLIDERDVILARKIRQAPGKTVVAIVGAGHVPGIIKNIDIDTSLEPLMQVPPKSLVPHVLKWGIPAVIAFLMVLGFF